MNGHFSYEMAKSRMAEEHRWAANERLAREARGAQRQDHGVSRESHQGVGFSLKRLLTHLAWT